MPNSKNFLTYRFNPHVRIIEGNEQVLHTTTCLKYPNTIINGNFDCARTLITTLEGSPMEVRGNFHCYSTRIDSLFGCPKIIQGELRIYNTDLTSLHNIHKHIESLGGTLYIDQFVRECLLGVFKIKRLWYIQIGSSGSNRNLREALVIVNQWLLKDRPEGTPLAPPINIHRCQEELIEAGLDKFAKL